MWHKTLTTLTKMKTSCFSVNYKLRTFFTVSRGTYSLYFQSEIFNEYGLLRESETNN